MILKEILEKEYKDFEKKAPNIIKNPISSKNMTPELSFSPVQKEMLNRENSSSRDGINVNGSLKSSIFRLYSSSTQKRMSNSRNKTEDSASSFIRNISKNNGFEKEFKSELNDLLGKKRKFLADASIEKEEKTRNGKLSVFLRK